MIRTDLFINGVAQTAANNTTYPVINPARPSEVVGKAAAASLGDVDDAVMAAHRAWPEWAALSMDERAAYLRKVATELNADEDATKGRVNLLTREHGKTLFESNIEIARLADRFGQVATMAEKVGQSEEIQGPMFDTLVVHQPRGVATLIVPWNWPLAILGAKLPQALLAGSTVVVKLSEQATLAPAQTVIKIAEMLPPGVVNLITGDGTVIGDRLVGHPLVRQVNFTGSIPVGRHIMKTAADNITPVTLELGGNDPGIVLADADLTPEFFQRLYLSVFLTTGQICMALKRLYIHRDLFDDVVDGLSAVMEKQVIGDGLKDGVTLGPLNNAKQQGIVSKMVAEAQEMGGSVHHYGRVEDDIMFNDGFFLRPSLVINADPSWSVVKDEQFGPTLPVIAFDNDDDAIAMANDSTYGLSSSVWSADNDHAKRVAHKLEAGFTNLNAHGPTAMDGLSPFGGVKQSGIGRNFGIEGISQFQETQSISGPSGSLFA